MKKIFLLLTLISILSAGFKNFIVTAFIEIPYGSNIKYELDKESKTIRVDRVLHTSMVYPANYGFIPKTLSKDGDPLDILILTDYPVHIGSYMDCKIVGVLVMEDEAGEDEKILAVPTEKIDPTYADINSLKDIPKSTLKKIEHFFKNYKTLESNKWVKIKGFYSKEKALEIIKKAKISRHPTRF